MGDLIQRLPTDEIFLPKEEQVNFSLLFGENQEEDTRKQQASVIYEEPLPNIQQPQQPMRATLPQQSVRMMKKELIHFVIFIIVFFIISMPLTISTVKSYVPMCQNSWVATCLVQSIVAACLMWIILNFEYSRK